MKQTTTVVACMMGIIVKILWKIYKTPLILLHAALLKTCLTSVRPAVDLSWKALNYGMMQVTGCLTIFSSSSHFMYFKIINFDKTKVV